MISTGFQNLNTILLTNMLLKSLNILIFYDQQLLLPLAKFSSIHHRTLYAHFFSGFLIDIQNAHIVKNIFFVQLTNFLSFLQMYVCEDCGHTTPEPEVHYLHLKDNHPFSPALHKFYDKRHFKFTNANFANMLLQVNS